MSYTIAIAGKGGVGKTTLAGLIVKHLVSKGKGPVFCVDADANSNFNEVLGIDVQATVGSVREDVLSNIDQIPAGMPKESFIEMKLQDAITETKDFDLIVMGRPEGPGCYCYANSLLRKYVDLLSENYEFVVIDNEAGMEHLSRRTTRSIDLLIVVADAAPVGIMTAGRINQLVDDMKLKVKNRVLILGRAGELHPAIEDRVSKTSLELAGVIPNDKILLDYSFEGNSVINLPENSAAVLAVNEIMDKLLP